MRPKNSSVFREALQVWLLQDAPSFSASIAFFALFSAGPVLMVALGIVGTLFGEEAARGELFKHLIGALGERGAGAVQQLLAHQQRSHAHSHTSGLGGVLLLIGTTGLFMEVRKALNRLAQFQATRPAVRGFLLGRALSFGAVLLLGILLLLSLFLNTLLSFSLKFLGTTLPQVAILLAKLNALTTPFLLVTIFGVLLKLFPDRRPPWKSALWGALLATFLFSAGRVVVALALRHILPKGAFGASTSLFVLLVWAYYSAAVFLLGASLTFVHSRFSRRA